MQQETAVFNCGLSQIGNILPAFSSVYGDGGQDLSSHLNQLVARLAETVNKNGRNTPHELVAQLMIALAMPAKPRAIKNTALVKMLALASRCRKYGGKSHDQPRISPL